jgi:hypothetical protein
MSQALSPAFFGDSLFCLIRGCKLGKQISEIRKGQPRIGSVTWEMYEAVIADTSTCKPDRGVHVDGSRR